MVLAAAAPVASNVFDGVLGFLVVAGMSLALIFLLRSMNKQLHKVTAGPPWRKKGPGRGQVGTDQEVRPGTSSRP